ncbi:alpha-E domain-containing protein [Novosphingobium mangrovi (ex Huang et al. 2023)]|uniref:Alpha-E domain-containing protein n=1 Tax=Novosphingobium mangrovi (ex Huang et al. 2023) TaxID=2976432 RepID=A0ABT2IA04_9SPHN|nr:alpha-E domain-containing protein [Novosphingobium mangrovi (ex Huang et al. 2023)]MCT2401660.1 alpha-E domain-containing protein [Novosphingobium mangrovi (ex Huang et al. 2023)]
MLGRAANGVYWMNRYLERAENAARLIDVGFHLALTRGDKESADEEWKSVLTTTGQVDAYLELYSDFNGPQVFNYLLRDKDNPASVLRMVENARTNARVVRTSLTNSVWEATNEGWMILSEMLARPVRETNLGEVLTAIRRQGTLVRGAMEGTMLRNEVFNFARIGTFIERADNTARILDVKYYVLLPSAAWVGSSLDNVQWDTLLRSVAGNRAYSWLNAASMEPRGIARFLILDGQFPRSLVFCYEKIRSNMAGLAKEYGHEVSAHELLRDAGARLHQTSIEEIFEGGLHEFLQDFIGKTIEIGNAIAADYRFIE